MRALRICERGHSGSPCAPRGVPRLPHPLFPPCALPRSAPLAAPRGPAASPRCCGQRGVGALLDCPGSARQAAERSCAGLGAADARRGSPRGASPAEPGPTPPPHRPTRGGKLTGLKAKTTEKRSYLRCIFGLAICVGLGGPAARMPCVRLAGSFPSRSPASPAHFSHQISH